MCGRKQAGVVPIVLYCNSIAKYCNTLVLQNLKVLQYLLQFFSNNAKSITKNESIAKGIAMLSKYCKKYCKFLKVLQKVLQNVAERKLF